MSDKADFTGQIRSKGLAGTGITEAIIGRHHRDKGGRVMIVASLHVASTTDNVDDGTGSVGYVIDDLEVAPHMAEEHIRELVRSFHYERKLQSDGPTLDLEGRGDEPTVEQVVAAGGRFEAHPFLPDDAAKDTPLCDVCGLVEDAGPHHTDRDLDGETSTDEPPLDDEDQADTETSYDNQPEGALA